MTGSSPFRPRAVPPVFPRPTSMGVPADSGVFAIGNASNPIAHLAHGSRRNGGRTLGNDALVGVVVIGQTRGIKARQRKVKMGRRASSPPTEHWIGIKLRIAVGVDYCVCGRVVGSGSSGLLSGDSATISAACRSRAI